MTGEGIAVSSDCGLRLRSGYAESNEGIPGEVVRTRNVLRGVVSSPPLPSAVADKSGSLLAHMSAPDCPRSGAFPLVAADVAPAEDDDERLESADMLRTRLLSVSPFGCTRPASSSSTASTLRSLDSDLRGWWVNEDDAAGWE